MVITNKILLSKDVYYFFLQNWLNQENLLNAKYIIIKAVFKTEVNVTFN